MIRRFFASTALVVGLSLPCQAQELAPEPAPAGTVEGATSLREAISAYLTQVPFDQGFLRIEPDPAGQRITLAPAAILTEIVGSSVHFAPFSLIVSERPDGTWNVFSRDRIDVSAKATVEGQEQTFEYGQASQVMKGIYAPALAAFTQGTGAAERIVSQQSDPLSRTRTTIAKATVDLTGQAGSNGGVDIDFHQTYRDYEQTTTIQLPASPEPEADSVPEAEGAPETGDAPGTDNVAAANPPQPGFEIAVLADEIDTRGVVKDGRTVAVRDLYALILDHATELETDAQATFAGPFGAELKTALGKVLPVWGSLTGEATARNVKLTSLYGAMGFAEGRQTLRFTGVEDNAGFDMDMTVKGLEASSPLLPPWSASLLPQEMEIGLTLSGADLKTPAEMALADVDFTQDPPLSPESQARIGAAFDPSRIALTLKPSRIRSADLDLSASGDVSFRDGAPAANVTLETVGLDKVIATLQEAGKSEPELNQTVGMLQFAKGFGRPKGEDRMEWIVAALADGSVTVNGTMVKGPDPIEDPDATPEDGGEDATGQEETPQPEGGNSTP